MSSSDPFNARCLTSTPLGDRILYKLDTLRGLGPIERLPYSIKVLLEACLRHLDGPVVTEDHVRALASYDGRKVPQQEIPFMPGRVVLQDFTGVPAVVDLAAMRSGIARLTGNAQLAKKINPLVPCDLVIDHSVQVDAFATGTALTINSQKDFERNQERYQFLKWGQSALSNFRVVPPATGIVHQVNLEYLAKVVWESKGTKGPLMLYPDSLVGTDSHTTMINGLGIVGWGVGGIEAEAVMLGQPIYMLIPEVIGFKLTGRIPQGSTATDLVLRITEMLRAHGVVGRFVEFFGEGLSHMPLANRATIANMAPEYGATIGFFPVDDQTIHYLRLTGRDEALIQTIEFYCKAQGLWRHDQADIAYSEVLELELDSVEPAVAGPKRPQDRIPLSAMKRQWSNDLAQSFDRPRRDKHVAEGTAGLAAAQPAGVTVRLNGNDFTLEDGAVVIAAITSCTNTSNPEVMIAAGLLARHAKNKGLVRKPWVKTSLAPGSKVVTDYYDRSGLTDDLEALGFYLVGYGCTTCIGNSGPLPEPISAAIRDGDLIAASVLSGNRNFEGRINPDTRANYLASPPLVVAYAIAGTVNIDLTRDPIGTDSNGKNVYLKDIWPHQKEVQSVIETSIKQEQFLKQYTNVFEGSSEWQAIHSTTAAIYEWNSQSTYIREPSFFQNLESEPEGIKQITGARCLAKFGDSVTTDHISPAGVIKADSPAGKYLIKQGVPANQFNSYGARRGNHQVMVRGTFANIRVRNQLALGIEGGFTVDFTKSNPPVTTIYEAAMNYQAANTPLVILAGKDYGMGSSRDWAAKGTFLLGVSAVLAQSFERIHRSNLVGMGVLPLQFKDRQSPDSLGLDGTETFDIKLDDNIQPGQDITITAVKIDGAKIEFTTTCRIDTPVEIDYYRNGGILHTVVRKIAASEGQ